MIETLDDNAGLAALQRQAWYALRALLRPQTYVGMALESYHTLVHAAAYPSGVSPVDFLQPLLLTDDALETVAATPSEEVAARPVVLIHGYLHNRSAFQVMARALQRAGIRSVHAFDYQQFTWAIDDIAADLAVQVDRLLEAHDARRCVLIGHSMGGIVARSYIQDHGGGERVHTLVTIGSPHAGTHSARFGVGPAARDMLVGSPLLRRLEETARTGAVRYVSYYSDLDACVVPAVSAKLTHPELATTNIRVADTGHLSMLLSAEVVASVVDHLVTDDHM